jgi:hypothetical protein
MTGWFDAVVRIGRREGVDCAGYILFAELLKVRSELKDEETEWTM